eukprot:s4067_g4.t1
MLQHPSDAEKDAEKVDGHIPRCSPRFLVSALHRNKSSRRSHRSAVTDGNRWGSGELINTKFLVDISHKTIDLPCMNAGLARLGTARGCENLGAKIPCQPCRTRTTSECRSVAGRLGMGQWSAKDETTGTDESPSFDCGSLPIQSYTYNFLLRG